jgi:ATP-dependent Clp protease ATP-binding subunit ClpX
MYDLPGLESVEQVVIGPEVVDGKTKPLFIHSDREREAPAAASA